MEKQITDLPILQKTRPSQVAPVKTESSCCSQPANASPCCTPSKTAEENNGACCAQPNDGSVCCDK